VCRTNNLSRIEFEAANELRTITRTSVARQNIMKLPALLMRTTRKALLAPGEALLLLRMAAWVSVLSLAVEVWPLPRALRLVSTKTRGRTNVPESETQSRLAYAIDQLLKTELWVLKPICWKRAAVLHRYLALSGIATRVLFGVRRGEDGAISGHAWLESSNGPVEETTTLDYAVTYTFPSNTTPAVDLSLLTER
jgi:Transglutaminase-like superfamily